MGWLGKLMGSGDVAPTSAAEDAAGPFQQEAHALYPDMDRSAAEHRLASNHAHIVAEGHELEMRVALEANHLSTLDDDALAARLEHTPLPRIDPIPEDEISQLAWFEDVLRSEHRDMVEGRIPFRQALRIAAAPRHEAPERLDVGVPTPGRGAKRLSDKEMMLQVRQIERMPSRLLHHRFRHVPGVVEEDIPPEHRVADRTEWTLLVMRADETRQLCGLSAPSDEDTARWMQGISIVLEDIDVAMLPGDMLAFTGTLFVDRRRLCSISSPGDGTYQGEDWSLDGHPDDLTELQAYVSMSSALRNDGYGKRPSTLFDVLLDQVMTSLTVSGYRAASTDAVLFCPDMNAERPEILAVAVPDDGSRTGAYEYILGIHPEAVILDEMAEEDAALLWMTLTS